MKLPDMSYRRVRLRLGSHCCPLGALVITFYQVTLGNSDFVGHGITSSLLEFTYSGNESHGGHISVLVFCPWHFVQL